LKKYVKEKLDLAAKKKQGNGTGLNKLKSLKTINLLLFLLFIALKKLNYGLYKIQKLVTLPTPVSYFTMK
jgi:hypothetical protein